MKEEIMGGLRNALEHGMSLEQGAQSFLNAGYNPQEVQEAVQALGGISARTSSTPLASVHSTPQKINSLPLQTIPSNQTIISSQTTSPLPEPKKSVWRYVLIGLSIVIVLLIAALIGVIAFSDQILQWLKPA